MPPLPAHDSLLRNFAEGTATLQKIIVPIGITGKHTGAWREFRRNVILTPSSLTWDDPLAVNQKAVGFAEHSERRRGAVD